MGTVSRHFAASIAIALTVAGNGMAAEAARKVPAQAYSVFHTDNDQVQYDNPSDSAPFTSLIDLSRHLMRTAVRMSKYAMPDALPMVSRVPRRELQERVCTDPGRNCKVAALFVSTRGVMIADDLEPESNLFHRSILFHEIVHYLQEEGRELATAAACDRWFQREQEAYALQNRFLASVFSPDRVSYSGARPSCSKDDSTHTHAAPNVKAPGATDESQ